MPKAQEMDYRSVQTMLPTLSPINYYWQQWNFRWKFLFDSISFFYPWIKHSYKFLSFNKQDPLELIQSNLNTSNFEWIFMVFSCTKYRVSQILVCIGICSRYFYRFCICVFGRSYNRSSNWWWLAYYYCFSFLFGE